MYLDAIEKKLSSKLLNFQKYGVAFAISNSGRCMIADDMGLGTFIHLHSKDQISFVIVQMAVCFTHFHLCL